MARPKISMRPLSLGFASIQKAARTVSLAFAPDPLIQWLARDPINNGWEKLPPRLQQWQEARLREYAVRGIAMEAVVTDDGDGPVDRHVGVCFLFPPKSQTPYRWLNPGWWPACVRVLHDQFWTRPVEPCADEERIGVMMEAHLDAAARIRGQYPPGSLYYLEIAAVDPAAQGLGAGGAIMSWVVERLGPMPCYLECTNEKNVAFYERYGFRLVEEKTLCVETGAPATTFYYMVRDGR